MAVENLGTRAVLATLGFAVALGLLIFLAAGSLAYWQGWLFWANYSACSAATTLYFLKHDPALVAAPEVGADRGAGAEPEAHPARRKHHYLLHLRDFSARLSFRAKGAKPHP